MWRVSSKIDPTFIMISSSWKMLSWLQIHTATARTCRAVWSNSQTSPAADHWRAVWASCLEWRQLRVPSFSSKSTRSSRNVGTAWERGETRTGVWVACHQTAVQTAILRVQFKWFINPLQSPMPTLPDFAEWLEYKVCIQDHDVYFHHPQQCVHQGKDAKLIPSREQQQQLPPCYWAMALLLRNQRH